MYFGQSILSLLLTYRYFVLFPLACFEGPVVALVAGFLVHLGYFDILPAFLIMCAGDFVSDVLYYYIGRFGSQKKYLEKYSQRYKFIGDNFPALEKLWHVHSIKTMFISKLAYGLSAPLLISAGLAKMAARKFISQAFLVTLSQYVIIMTIGYYLGYSYNYAIKYIKFTGILIAVALIIFIIVYVSVQKYARREIEKLEKQEEPDLVDHNKIL